LDYFPNHEKIDSQTLDQRHLGAVSGAGYRLGYLEPGGMAGWTGQNGFTALYA